MDGSLRLEFPVICLTIRATVQVSRADWSKLVSVAATRLNFHELCDKFRPHVARLSESGVRLFHTDKILWNRDLSSGCSSVVEHHVANVVVVGSIPITRSVLLTVPVEFNRRNALAACRPLTISRTINPCLADSDVRVSSNPWMSSECELRRGAPSGWINPPWDAFRYLRPDDWSAGLIPILDLGCP